MLQKFAMVKYGVFVAKICKHALRASAVRDIWWSPLARQLLPPWPGLLYSVFIFSIHCNEASFIMKFTFASGFHETDLLIIAMK